MAQYAANWEANTGHQQSLWLPGVGDHGGGPTPRHAYQSKTLVPIPLFPDPYLHPRHPPPRPPHPTQSPPSHLPPSPTPPTPPTSPTSPIPPYLTHLTHSHPPHPSPPGPTNSTWNSTAPATPPTPTRNSTTASAKTPSSRPNLFASLATIQGLRPYPKAELETAWKQVLFNQFHDILPGSSIPEVFAEANQNWQTALDTGTQILQQSLQAIAEQVDIPQPPVEEAVPVILFNPLNWAS